MLWQRRIHTPVSQVSTWLFQLWGFLLSSSNPSPHPLHDPQHAQHMSFYTALITFKSLTSPIRKVCHENKNVWYIKTAFLYISTKEINSVFNSLLCSVFQVLKKTPTQNKHKNKKPKCQKNPQSIKCKNEKLKTKKYCHVDPAE